MSIETQEFAVVISDENRVYSISIQDIFPSDLDNIVLVEKERIENGYSVRAFLQSTDQIINGKIVYFSDSQENCEKQRILEERKLLIANQYSPSLKKIKMDENNYNHNKDYSIIENMKLEHFKTIRIYERNMNILRQCLKEKECIENWNLPSTSDDLKVKQNEMKKNEESLKEKEISFQTDLDKSKKQEEAFRTMLIEEKDILRKKVKEIEERERRCSLREEKLKIREDNLLLREHRLNIKQRKNNIDKSLVCEDIDIMTNGSNDADSNLSTTDPLMNVEIELNELDSIKKEITYNDNRNTALMIVSSDSNLKWTKDPTIPEMEPLMPNCSIRVKYYYLDRARNLAGAKDYVKYMLPILYEEDEMIGRNAKGGRNTKNPEAPNREGLDPERLDALIESAKHYYSKDFRCNLIKEADLIKDINIKLCNLRKSRCTQELFIKGVKQDRFQN